MKTAIFSLFVILLSAVGANVLASEIDLNVKRNTFETTNTGAGDNGRNGGGGSDVIQEK